MKVKKISSLFIIIILLIGLLEQTVYANESSYKFESLAKYGVNVEPKIEKVVENGVTNECASYAVPLDPDYPQMIEFRKELYVVWSQKNDSHNNRLRIKKFDGQNWIEVEHGFDEYVFLPKAVVYKDELYVMWHGEDDKQVMIKYDGEKWTNCPLDDMIVNPKAGIYEYNFAVYKDELYCAFSEIETGIGFSPRYAFIIKKYDGKEWKDVNEGYSVSDLPRVKDISFLTYNEKLYITFVECPENDSEKILRVKEFDGEHWAIKDNMKMISINKDGKEKLLPYKRNGINFCFPLVGLDVKEPKLFIYNGSLYIIWVQHAVPNGGGFSYDQIRIYKYIRKDDNWEQVVADLSEHKISAESPQVIVSNGKLYIMWAEETILYEYGHQTIYIKTFDGTNWELIKPSNNMIFESAYVPQFLEFNNQVYTMWMDGVKIYVNKLVNP